MAAPVVRGGQLASVKIRKLIFFGCTTVLASERVRQYQHSDLLILKMFLGILTRSPHSPLMPFPFQCIGRTKSVQG